MINSVFGTMEILYLLTLSYFLSYAATASTGLMPNSWPTFVYADGAMRCEEDADRFRSLDAADAQVALVDRVTRAEASLARVAWHRQRHRGWCRGNPGSPARSHAMA